MTITRSDIKLAKSQKMTDETDAGGFRTSNIVEDGKLNEIFDNVGTIDHSDGNVSLRKVFATVDTANTTTYGNAHIIIAKPPEDSRVSVMAFVGSNEAEQNADAKERVAGYAGKTIVITDSQILGEQFADAEALYLTTGYDFEVDKVYYIGIEYSQPEDEGLKKGGQYFKVTKITNYGTYQQVEIDPPLNRNYPKTASVYDPAEGGYVDIQPTVLRQTSELVDNAQYAGVTILAEDITAGDDVITVNETETQLVPFIKGVFVEDSQVSVEASDAYKPLNDDGSGKVRTVSVVETAFSTTKNVTVEITDVPNVGSITAIAKWTETSVTHAGLSNFTRILRVNEEGTIFGSVSYVNGQLKAIFSQNVPTGAKVTFNYISQNAYPPATTDDVDVDGNDPNLYTYTLPADTAIVESSLLYEQVTAQTSSSKTIDRIYDKDGQILKKSTVQNFGTFMSQNTTLTDVGTINYESGEIRWTESNTNLPLELFNNMYLKNLLAETSETVFNITVEDFKVDSLNIKAKTPADVDVSLSADENGDITGTGGSGTVVDGVVSITFDAPVLQESIEYDFVYYRDTAVPEELTGIDPVRLPRDGRVPFIRQFSTIVIHNTQEQAVTTPAINDTIDLGRINVGWVDIVDADGISLYTSDDQHYSLDQETGIVTVNTDWPNEGFTAPFTAFDMIEETVLVSGVQSNRVYTALPITRDYTAGETYVSSMLKLQDLFAQVKNVFDQSVWQDNWSNDVTGDVSDAGFDDINNPITVTNRGAITERWRIEYLDGENFRLYGEQLGLVATGNNTVDFSPVNPQTSLPYFTIPAAGWSGGWSIGNILRFNTVGAAKPIWFVRSVLPSIASVEQDDIRVQIRGNITQG